MTVAEMIEALLLLPPEAEVLVNGYEGGLDPACAPELIRIARDVNSSWYEGQHEEVTEPDEAADATAVLIGRSEK